MQAYQQLCGFNTLMYYSASLFQEIGFNQPTAVGLIISGTNFIFTLFALKYIDIVGRRKIMVFSAPGMVFGLTLASIAFHCMFSINCTIGQVTDLDLVDMTQHTGGDLVSGASYSKSWSAIVLLSMIIFVASYATGLGNVPWQQGELFGLEGQVIVSPVCQFSTDVFMQSAALAHRSRLRRTGLATFSSALHTSPSWQKLPLPVHLGSTQGCAF